MVFCYRKGSVSFIRGLMGGPPWDRFFVRFLSNITDTDSFGIMFGRVLEGKAKKGVRLAWKKGQVLRSWLVESSVNVCRCRRISMGGSGVVEWGWYFDIGRVLYRFFRGLMGGPP